LVKIEKKNIGYFTGRPRRFDNVDGCAKYFVVQKHGKEIHCGISKGTLDTFGIVDVYLHVNNHTKGTYCWVSVAAVFRQTRHYFK
jgi:hypothetical protein